MNLYFTVIYNNKKAYQGGGIFSHSNIAAVNIYNSSIINNIATQFHGGIYMYKTIGHIYGSNISSNNGADYGGMMIQYSNILLEDTTISHNRAIHEGGGSIYLVKPTMMGHQM